MITPMIKLIEEIFFEKLQAKTGWGRNEIMKIYREAVNETLFKTIVEMDKPSKKIKE